MIGSHMSIAGGHVNALKRAHACGMQTVAMFTASPRIWKRPELSDINADDFHKLRQKLAIQNIIGHALYLANPGTQKKELLQKSIQAITQELKICHCLRIPWLVIHPGSDSDGNVKKCIERIARVLDQCLEKADPCTTGIALETTSGSGHSVGGKLEHLSDIIAASRYPDRYGVCLDTCHMFAAGYDFRSYSSWHHVRNEIQRVLGFQRVRCLHVNDSKGDLASNLDRHEHIGQGKIGDEGFRHILNEPLLANVPLILETPKDANHRLDRLNRDRLALLMNS